MPIFAQGHGTSPRRTSAIKVALDMHIQFTRRFRRMILPSALGSPSEYVVLQLSGVLQNDFARVVLQLSGVLHVVSLEAVSDVRKIEMLVRSALFLLAPPRDHDGSESTPIREREQRKVGVVGLWVLFLPAG